jgi:MFS family permease
VLAGLTNEFYRPASSALLADLVPPRRRITAFATLRMAFNAGFAFGPATAGFLAAYGFFWLFAGNAAASVLYGLVALFLLPRTVPTPEKTAGWGHALQFLRRDYKLHQLLLANFAMGILFCQPASTFGLYVTGQGFSGAVYGAILSLNGVLVVLVELPLTTVTRKFPTRRVMAIGYAIIGTGFALNAFAHTVAALVVCIAIFTLGEMVAIPTSMAYVANLAPPEIRGRYIGFSGLSWSAAAIVGPVLGMKLFTAAPGAYWAACAAMGLFAATVISLPNPKPEPLPEPTR